MRILFQNDQFTFAATTINEGDFLRPIRSSLEKENDFLNRQREYAKRLRQAMATIGAHPLSIHAPELCHSAVVAWVGGAQDSFPAETDGLATNEPGVTLVVTGADCPSIFIMDSASHSIALVHSGREGTRQNIAAEAMRLLIEHTSASPKHFNAMIGPGICGDHYEVNADIAAQFSSYDNAIRRKTDGNCFLDLDAIILTQLKQAGISTENIHTGALGCTYEDRNQWFSYRRDTHDGLRLDRPRVQAFVAIIR